MSGYGYHWTPCRGGGTAGPLVLGAVLVAGEIVLNLLWEIIAVTAACAALSFAAVLLLMRWTARREAAFGAALAARRERPALAATVSPQVTQPERPAIPQAVIFNFYGADPMAARAFQAIPGPSGDATMKEE